MRLTALRPMWWADSPARRGQGMAFDCPHCVGSGYRIAIAFKNSLDRGSHSVQASVLHQRWGASFDRISVQPRIYHPGHASIEVTRGFVKWAPVTP